MTYWSQLFEDDLRIVEGSIGQVTYRTPSLFAVNVDETSEDGLPVGPSVGPLRTRCGRSLPYLKRRVSLESYLSQVYTLSPDPILDRDPQEPIHWGKRLRTKIVDTFTLGLRLELSTIPNLHRSGHGPGSLSVVYFPRVKTIKEETGRVGHSRFLLFFCHFSRTRPSDLIIP